MILWLKRIITRATENALESYVCILTGAEGEDPDDCTTHEHEGDWNDSSRIEESK